MDEPSNFNHQPCNLKYDGYIHTASLCLLRVIFAMFMRICIETVGK